MRINMCKSLLSVWISREHVGFWPTAIASWAQVGKRKYPAVISWHSILAGRMQCVQEHQTMVMHPPEYHEQMNLLEQ